MKLPVIATVAGLFSAPAERVFDAFPDKKIIGRFMFGPEIRDEEIVSLQNEPGVGGSFSYVVRRQGKTFDHTGEYVEIDRPHHLVFTWTVKENTSIDGCELTLTHDMPHGQEGFVEKSKVAWGKMIDKLTEILDQQT